MTLDKTLPFDQFETLAAAYPAVQVYRQLAVGDHVPVELFGRVLSRHRPAVLLESASDEDRDPQYSYICLQPQATVTQTGERLMINGSFGEGETHMSLPALLRAWQSAYRCEHNDALPPFSGGLVGYLGYESIAWLESVPVHTRLSGDIPDALFMLFESVLAFDHREGSICLIYTSQVHRSAPLRPQYEHCLEQLAVLEKLLTIDAVLAGPVTASDVKPASNMNQTEFEQAVLKAQEHIVRGDIFQVVLSQCFSRPTSTPPELIYSALTEINPSPYMYHLQFDDFAIIGTSPETLVKVEGREVQVRPIAGTRPRDSHRAADDRLAAELLADEKERAEHVMLVDLGRNDVGRVAKYGTVQVEQFMAVERYSHVMHLVSRVVGQLREEVDAIDALLAGFPAGTVSGAPKIRAMEIIHALEPGRRGIYAGAIGYFDFQGNLDTCIAIRTLLLQDGVAYFQSGAGIVADSNPAREFDETLAKAQVIVEALQRSERGIP